MKLDLKWNYNNIRIKEVNEWKLTLEELIEPIVMFFSLTNSLVIFQAIINELLRDLVNMGQVASFIDNMLIEKESKKEHDKLVKEILIRIELNNLYMKLEKCK